MNTIRQLLDTEHGRAVAARGLVVFVLLLLGACGSTRENRTVNREVLNEIDAALDTITGRNNAAQGMNEAPPEAVLQALVPGLTLNSEDLQPVEERFDFAVQEPMDAREFFTLLTEGTDYSIVIHPEVTGTISALDLKNVTIQESMNQISALYGFVIKRTGNIYQVLPGGLQTRIFKINYLNVSRSGSSNMSIVATGILGGGGGGGGGGGNNNNNNNNNNLNNGQNNTGQNNNGQGGNSGNSSGGSGAGGASISTSSESDYWSDLEDIISSIINAGSSGGSSVSEGLGLLGSLAPAASSSERSVIISPQTGMIVVRAYPSELEQVAEFLRLSQAALERQVVLEAKILEVELKEAFQMGIDLSLLGKINGNDAAAGFSFLGASVDSISSPLKMSYGSTNFEGVIQLLETQGNVQVISSPRIATLNNQKAVFKVGDEQYFQTGANSTSFGAGEQQTTNASASLQPFFSGIALDVTPQISDTGDIILHIHPLLNSVQEDIKVISGNEFSLANSTTRESDSVARARNGEVIIISGLMQTRARGSEAGIPGAQNVPVIGAAFGQTQTETVKTELVILLRAIVDEGSNMQQLIQDHSDSFQDLRSQIDPYNR